MEKCKDRTIIKPRSRIDTIDHYASIAILVILGCFLLTGAYWVIKSWPI